ncbi:hypothetical protein EV424DRAFT_1357108 [Suillus variegatus]|nr:hypothetical protein EV424DRAFT_1357108 [Suillus variegatus]
MLECITIAFVLDILLLSVSIAKILMEQGLIVRHSIREFRQESVAEWVESGANLSHLIRRLVYASNLISRLS